MAEAAPKPKAEEKDTVPDSETTFWDVAEKIFLLLIGLAFLLSAYNQIVSRNVEGNVFWQRFDWVKPIVEKVVFSYTLLATLASLFFIFAIIYSTIKMFKVEDEWYESLYPKIDEEVAVEEKNSRWNMVVNHIQSDNPSDWRLAILESDIILSDLLDTLAYRGDTIGDRLKAAERSPFQTLRAAWEAHRIRNAIAHEGQDFVLTQREARRVIGLYETVFREFDFI